MRHRTWAPLVHAVTVGAAAGAGVLMISDDPRALWVAAAVAAVSRAAGSYISHRRSARPFTVRELATVGRELRQELHAVNNKVTIFLAELDMLVDADRRGYPSRTPGDSHA